MTRPPSSRGTSTNQPKSRNTPPKKSPSASKQASSNGASTNAVVDSTQLAALDVESVAVPLSNQEAPFSTVPSDKEEDSEGVVDTPPLDKPAAVMVPPDLIVTASTQPRRYFDSKAMESLVASVKKDGILQPLLLRPLGDDKFEIVGGERRFKAALSCGLKEVPAVVREMTDTEVLEFALAENLQREDLNAIEETEAILDLLALKLKSDRFGVISLLNRLARIKRGVAYNDVHVERLNIVEEVFTDIGKMSRESFRVHRLPLLNLPADILSALRNGQIAYTKALEIAKVSDDVERADLLSEAHAQNLSVSQIKNKVLAINPPSDGDELQERIGVAYKLAKKSKAWDNPELRSKLQDLLTQVEELLSL